MKPRQASTLSAPCDCLKGKYVLLGNQLYAFTPDPCHVISCPRPLLLLLQNGTLSRTATQLLGTTSSFKRTDDASDPSEAFQRMGSFPIATGEELFAAMGVAAATAPAPAGNGSNSNSSSGGGSDFGDAGHASGSASASATAPSHNMTSPTETDAAAATNGAHSNPQRSSKLGTSGDPSRAPADSLTGDGLAHDSLAHDNLAGGLLPGDDEDTLRLRGGASMSSMQLGASDTAPVASAGRGLDSGAESHPGAVSGSPGFQPGPADSSHTPEDVQSAQHSMHSTHNKHSTDSAAGAHSADGNGQSLPAVASSAPSATAAHHASRPEAQGGNGAREHRKSGAGEDSTKKSSFSLKTRSFFGKVKVGGVRPSGHSDESMQSEAQSEAERQHEQVHHDHD